MLQPISKFFAVDGNMALDITYRIFTFSCVSRFLWDIRYCIQNISL